MLDISRSAQIQWTNDEMDSNRTLDNSGILHRWIADGRMFTWHSCRGTPMTANASAGQQVERPAEPATSVNEWSTPEMATRRDEADDSECSHALYWADEPLASQMQQTSAADVEQMCADAQIACVVA